MNYRYIGVILLALAVPAWSGCASGAEEREAVSEPTEQPTEQADEQPSADEQRLEGAWQGVLAVSGAELTIVFHLAPAGDDAGWEATMDSPDQGATGIPVSEVEVDGEQVELTVPSIGGVYEGTLRDDQIDGSWTQQGQSFPLDLERVGAEEARGVDRPQNPEPPYPYEDEQVEFPGGADGVTLAGTLTVPDAEGPHPAVVLVTGSGPQDRDETLAGHKPFLVLADHLTRQGLAVLRYDDRGVGESTGDFAGATIDDFTADAASAVAFLTARDDINTDAVGVVGHSEGANIAPMVATDDEAVDFLVLLAPTAVPGDELLARQNALIFEGMGMSPEGASAYERRMRQAITPLLEIPLDEPVPEEVLADLRADFEAAAEAMSAEDRAVYGPTEADAFEPVLDAVVEQLKMPWMRSFLAMDFAATFEEVDVPTLAVFGTKDLQVPPAQNADALREALADNEQATVEVLEGLNHLFQPAETGLPGEYAQISTTLAPELLDRITDWLVAQSPASISR